MRGTGVCRVTRAVLVITLLVSGCATEPQHPPASYLPTVPVTDAHRLACEEAVGGEKPAEAYNALGVVLLPVTLPVGLYLGALGGMVAYYPHFILLPLVPFIEGSKGAEANRFREAALRACLDRGPVEGPVLARRMLTRMLTHRYALRRPDISCEPGPEPSNAAEADLIRSIQEGLQEIGYLWVPVDGRLGSCTRAAIRLFQNSPEYTGRFVDEMPSQQLLTDIERARQRDVVAK